MIKIVKSITVSMKTYLVGVHVGWFDVCEVISTKIYDR